MMEIVASRSWRSDFILLLMSVFLSALLKNPFIISLYLSRFCSFYGCLLLGVPNPGTEEQAFNLVCLEDHFCNHKG